MSRRRVALVDTHALDDHLVQGDARDDEPRYRGADRRLLTAHAEVHQSGRGDVGVRLHGFPALPNLIAAIPPFSVAYRGDETERRADHNQDGGEPPTHACGPRGERSPR